VSPKWTPVWGRAAGRILCVQAETPHCLGRWGGGLKGGRHEDPTRVMSPSPVAPTGGWFLRVHSGEECILMSQYRPPFWLIPPPRGHPLGDGEARPLRGRRRRAAGTPLRRRRGRPGPRRSAPVDPHTPSLSEEGCPGKNGLSGPLANFRGGACSNQASLKDPGTHPIPAANMYKKFQDLAGPEKPGGVPGGGTDHKKKPRWGRGKVLQSQFPP